MRKEYYETYKSMGVCTSCGKNKAENGKVLCLECAAEDRARIRKYDKERKASYTKRKKELCDAFGVCTTCLARDKYNGKRCKECYTKSKEKYKEKQKSKGMVPRELRFDMDLCYTCGEPVEEGYSFCSKHLGSVRGNIKKGREEYLNTNVVKLTKDEQRDKKLNYKRRKRDLCSAFGVCTSCMCRDKSKGVLCIDCYLKIKRSYRAKQTEKGVIPSDLRVGMSLCYICGASVIGDNALCSKHLAIARSNLMIARSGATYAEMLTNHKWVAQRYSGYMAYVNKSKCD